MSRRTLLLLIAGVIAAFTAISVRNRLSQTPVVEAPVQTTRIVVAKRDLPPGSFIQGTADLDWGPGPDATAPVDPNNPDATPAAEVMREGTVSLADFNGAVVRHQLRAGEAVPASALMKSGEGGFMSAVLNAGMRAVSIAVTVTSGNAGFVSPGDHVDLIVTHRVKTRNSDNTSDESVVSETFVHGVRVVAVDQMLDNPENKAILAKTVTVEVTPRQAEQIAVATEMGKISIALRSLMAGEKKPELVPVDDSKPAGAATDLYGNVVTDAPASDYTSDNDISRIRSAVIPRVQVIRGEKTEMLEFYKDTQ
jgi:pilus assembly protein CpaB